MTIQLIALEKEVVKERRRNLTEFKDVVDTESGQPFKDGGHDEVLDIEHECSLYITFDTSSISFQVITN